MKNSKVKNIAFYGVMTALALVFSYLESFIPISSLVPVPGVKLGFANIVVVFALYTMKTSDAIIIGVLRVLLSGLLFGNMMTVAYSIAGCFFSWLVMTLTKNSRLSIIGVSMLGGITHNAAQLVVAAFLTGTLRIVYYIPVLLISGTVTGFLMGYASKLVIDRISKIVSRTS